MNIPPFDDESYVYTERNAWLQRNEPVSEPQGTGLTPAEMHGLISGMICGVTMTAHGYRYFTT